MNFNPHLVFIISMFISIKGTISSFQNAKTVKDENPLSDVEVKTVFTMEYPYCPEDALEFEPPHPSEDYHCHRPYVVSNDDTF